MTVTVYTATFIDRDGKKFHGSISWAKDTPRRLDAALCPHITESEVDYAQWTQTATYGRIGLETLIRKMKSKAERMHLTLVSEGETDFPVRQGLGFQPSVKDSSIRPKTIPPLPTEELPDPTGKTVIILAGEYAGQEGFCLGPVGEKGVFAVTPNTSNRVLQLHFDDEFGILVNPKQETGNN